MAIRIVQPGTQKQPNQGDLQSQLPDILNGLGALEVVGANLQGVNLVKRKDPVLQRLEKQKAQLDVTKAQKDMALKEKIPAAQLGYYTMATAALNDYKTLTDMIKNKELTYDDIRLAYGKVPNDNTALINQILYSASDSWLRIQTGATANPAEVVRDAAKFAPRGWDSDKAIDRKMKALFVDRLGLYRDSLVANSSGGKIPGLRDQNNSGTVEAEPTAKGQSKGGTTFTVGTRRFENIPPNEVAAFMKQFPKAVRAK